MTCTAMPYALLADSVLLLHGLFVLFVVFGGLLARYSAVWVWIHLPALAWGTVVEVMGWICPLTPLEQWFRRLARQTGGQAGIIEPYLMPLLYPVGLTRETQWLLAVALILFNLVVYGLWWKRWRRGRDPTHN